MRVIRLIVPDVSRPRIIFRAHRPRTHFATPEVIEGSDVVGGAMLPIHHRPRIFSSDG